MDRPREIDGAATDGPSVFLRGAWVDQARQFQDVIAGRCKVFTCIQDDHGAESRSLLVAVPRGSTAPHALTVLRLSMPGLLPLGAIDGDTATASIPEPRFVMDLIVRTIEDTIQTAITARPVAPQDRPASDHVGPGAIADAQTEILKFLTPRQREILRLMGIGRSNAEIAAQLGISMNTVKLHVSAILRRLDLRSRMQAIALGARISQSRADEC
jgi:DNA-binding CsgD family transcriptional regulator